MSKIFDNILFISLLIWCFLLVFMYGRNVQFHKDLLQIEHQNTVIKELREEINASPEKKYNHYWGSGKVKTGTDTNK